MQVRLLGPMAVSRERSPLALPASRKVRALFAYLALAPLPVPRSQLCELLWDVPDDPRGALRWSLSRLRALVDSLLGPARAMRRASRAARASFLPATRRVISGLAAGPFDDRLLYLANSPLVFFAALWLLLQGSFVEKKISLAIVYVLLALLPVAAMIGMMQRE